MLMQGTIILLLTLLSCPLLQARPSSHVRVVDRDTLLERVGHMLPMATIEGTMSLEGTMTIGNLPFVARIHHDTVAVTVQAPFGMIAGTVFVTSDTFIVVNYFSREALVGHPDAESIASASPIPLNLADIRAFLRGTVPGDVVRFQQGSRRTDGKVLFVARDSATTEFVLVDTVTSTLAQYQRKSRSGSTELNMVLGDVRAVEAAQIPYAVDVDVEDKTQSVRFRFESVEPRVERAAIMLPEIPDSFTRRVYSR